MGKGLNRIATSERLPDLGSFRTRWLWGLGIVLSSLALTAIAALYVEERQHYEEQELARAEAVARTAAVWMNGDVHQKLADDHPEGSFPDWQGVPPDLASMCDDVHAAGLQNGLQEPIRTLRVTSGYSSAVLDAPDQVHPGAMEVIASGANTPTWKERTAYLPAMGKVLHESQSLAHDLGGTVHAYAPIKDSWGNTVGLAEVRLRSNAPLMMRLSKLVAWVVLAAVLVFGLLKALDFFLRRHCHALEQIALETRRILAGNTEAPVWREASARELLRIIDALEERRSLADPARHWAPEEPQAPVQAPEPKRLLRRPRKVQSTGPLRFDLRLLLDQAVQRVRGRAKAKRLELRILLGEQVPAQLDGNPEALLSALTGLLENAVRFTRTGSVTLRVTRVVDGTQLRFEVADTGVGVPWQHQPKLDEDIAKAAGRKPTEIKGGLLRASAFAASMGGQVGFESQPGAGSRFWLSLVFQAGQTAGVRPLRPVGV